MVIKSLYKKRKRISYFIKVKPTVQLKLDILYQLHFKSEILKTVKKFHILLKGLNQTQAAIYIQKIWRGYIRRKLYKKMKNKTKSKHYGSDDEEDVDTDFFNQ